MSRWPAFRTPRGGHRELTPGVVIKAALAGIVGPALLGGVLMLFGTAFGDLFGYAGDLPIAAFGVGVIMAFSPTLSWAGMLIGVPLSLFALSRGFAGWAAALGFGGLAGALVGAPLSSAPILAVSGIICAGPYWLTLRWLCPQALIATEAKKSPQNRNS